MVVGISTETITELHPVLYHMAEYGTWESIKRHGLLSTTALLDLFGPGQLDRKDIEGSLRKRPITILDAEREKIVIRDQRPLSKAKLAGCLLDGLTPEDWCLKLNGKVFFWLVEDRLIRLMKAYADREHLILEIDTAELLKRHGERVMLAPMNTGTTRPMAFARGHNTFLPPDKYPFEANKKTKGGARKAIVELTVEYSVADIADLTVRATHQRFEQGIAVVSEFVYSK